MATAARPYHHGNLRSALMQAAEGALERGGVQSLSLRELAREIGVSHAAPRRHFPDRQALLDALAHAGFERLGAQMERAVEGAGDGVMARFAAIGQAYVRFATEHAALLEVMYAGKHRPGADALHEAASRAFATPMALMAAGQASGEVVAGDPARVATVAWASLQGLAAMANNGLLGSAPPDELDELVAEAVERLFDGLRPRPSTPG